MSEDKLALQQDLNSKFPVLAEELDKVKKENKALEEKLKETKQKADK
jgi:hypothetical protein